MESNTNKLFRFLAVLALLNALLGCSLTHTLKSADIPQLQVGSPLKSVPPLTFAFKEFKGGGNKDDLIGDFGIHKYKLDQPVATVVAKAIRKELERNGHTCIAESTSKADFVVDGTVYKYFLSMEYSGPRISDNSLRW
jgi:hypothetical protein